MKLHRITNLLFVGLLLTLVACSTLTPQPTITPEPSSTPQPTATNTPLPTDTPEPTPTITPVPEPVFKYGERVEVPAGGFSFLSLEGYEVEIQESWIGTRDQSGYIIISLFGEVSYSGNQTPEELIDEFLSELVERGAEFELGDPYAIVINDVEGVSIDLSGMLGGFPIKGQTVLVMPAKDQYFYGLAATNISTDSQKWDQEGHLAFLALLDSIKFLERQTLGEGLCPIAADDTYGYSMDNPVRVGGDWFEGPSRETAYLDALSGPNGEEVSYYREGSLPYGDTILDIFNVSYGQTEVILYLDEYAFEELMAPVGFSCWKEIPLSAP